MASAKVTATDVSLELECKQILSGFKIGQKETDGTPNIMAVAKEIDPHIVDVKVRDDWCSLVKWLRHRAIYDAPESRPFHWKKVAVWIANNVPKNAAIEAIFTKSKTEKKQKTQTPLQTCSKCPNCLNGGFGLEYAGNIVVCMHCASNESKMGKGNAVDMKRLNDNDYAKTLGFQLKLFSWNHE